ncbi:MAG: YitT family protein [Lachnospiraceae bacterium]|nr:YitT family protein [Lachnospiraceae bacterium]MDY4969627.1 YitT family protein [Lachnospiraceae bacterium]
MKKTIRQLIIIIAASAVYAAGISLFLDPNNLAPGGVTGISVILNRLTDIPTGTLYFLLNVPIMVLGLWKFGLRFIAKTAFAIICTSVFTNTLGHYEPLTKEPLLAAAAGSVLVAVGIGFVFKAGATTGGTDIIIKVLRQKRPHLKTGFLFLVTDFIIVFLSGFVFHDLDTVLYALLAVIISGKVLDYVLYGSDEARMVFVITRKHRMIADRMMREIETGVTYLHGTGAYSMEDKEILMCVVRKQQAPRVEEVVRQEDSEAFMIVTSATEIFGEGYKSFFAEKL